MKYEKLKNKLNINSIFIAPIMEVADFQNSSIFEKDDIIYRMSTRVIYCKKEKTKTKFVDLKSNMVYLEYGENLSKEVGEMYISEQHMIPFKIFVRPKYKNKCIDKEKILEIANFVLRSNNISNLDPINSEYVYITRVFDSKDNVIKEQATVYRIGNRLIDVNTKETYLLDDGIVDKYIEGDLKIVKPEDLTLKQDDNDDNNKKLIKKGRK